MYVGTREVICERLGDFSDMNQCNQVEIAEQYLDTGRNAKSVP